MFKSFRKKFGCFIFKRMYDNRTIFVQRTSDGLVCRRGPEVAENIEMVGLNNSFGSSPNQANDYDLDPQNYIPNVA